MPARFLDTVALGFLGHIALILFLYLTLSQRDWASIAAVRASVAAVQSGAVQVETWCQLVLNKFTPVHTGATWPLMANQSAGLQFVIQTLYESLRGQCIYNKR